MVTKDELRILQGLSLDLKIAKSKNRIQEWYNYWGGQVYVSFSGGKDSTVLKHLVENTVGTVPGVFCDTGLEYPEIKEFVKSQNNVEIIRPSMAFNQVIKEYGYPIISKEISHKVDVARRNPEGKYAERFKKDNYHSERYQTSLYDCSKYAYLLDAPFMISNKCCDIMKKKPFKAYEKSTGRKGFVGTMAIESQLRKTVYLKHGCNAFDNIRPLSSPLSFWTEQDILEYLSTYNVSYCSVYGDIVFKDGKYITTGLNRTGCMFCMYGMSQDGKLNRFQQMQHTHPNIYNYCMKPVGQGGLGLQEVLSFMGIDYEDSQMYL